MRCPHSVQSHVMPHFTAMSPALLDPGFRSLFSSFNALGGSSTTLGSLGTSHGLGGLSSVFTSWRGLRGGGGGGAADCASGAVPTAEKPREMAMRLRASATFSVQPSKVEPRRCATPTRASAPLTTSPATRRIASEWLSGEKQKKKAKSCGHPRSRADSTDRLRFLRRFLGEGEHQDDAPLQELIVVLA